MKKSFKMGIALMLTILITLITVLPQPNVEAASFTVSKSSVTLDIGKSSTITINSSTHTGRINITSSNFNVASVSAGSLWVENNSQTITISAKSAGNATITISGELFDSALEQELTYTKTISVTVNKPKEETSGGSGNQSGTGSDSSNQGGSTTGGLSGGSNSSGNVAGGSSNSGSLNTGNSGGSSSGTTSKPSSGITSSKPNTGITSKPSGSSQTTTFKPVQNATSNNNTNVKDETQQITTPVEIIEENNQEDNVETIEEIANRDNLEANLITEQENNENLENAEVIQKNIPVKQIIITGVISIAVFITGIGIFISRKILKK